MAALPQFNQLDENNFKDMPSWFSPLFAVISQMSQSLYDALNHNTTFAENCATAFKTLDFETDDTYVSANKFTVIKFKNEIKGDVVGVLLVDLKTKQDVPILKGNSITWREEEGNVVISYISGLSDTTNYKATFLIMR